MTSWIALFRGINVGGRNKLPMKELVLQLKSLQLKKIQTYIQSGNVVFDSTRRSAEKLSAAIATCIEKGSGFRPQVMLLGSSELQKAVSSNPFSEGESDPKSLHFFFLSSKPGSPDLESLASAQSSNERFELKEKVFYLHAPDGIGRSKLAANAEKYLGVPATARNWRTVQKLLEMVSS